MGTLDKENLKEIAIFETAIKALEKQMPKPPTLKEVRYYEGARCDVHCGSCDIRLDKSNDYCGKCGQKIDWR